jgi:FkbM family methyltransferase
MKEKYPEPFYGLHKLPQPLHQKALTPRTMLRYLATRLVGTTNEKVRNFFFNVLSDGPGADFAYVNRGRERYLVNCHDKTISKAVFIAGEFQFEKFEIALKQLRLQTSIAELELLVDVGANIGTVCIPAVARGLVHAAVGIEPHPVNCKLLRANIALNSLDERVTVHECAVGEHDNETLMLELSTDNWGDHRIAVTSEDGEFGEAARQTMAVQSMRLDGLVEPSRAKNTLIWIDAQGYEGFILKGAEALLEARVPLVTEFWPYGMRRTGSYSVFRELLSGYRGFIDLNVEAAVNQGHSGGAYTLRPMSDLNALHDALDVSAWSYTEILVV